jgi:hypothetical protein
VRTDDALVTVRRIAQAVTETIADTPEGAPGGVLYAVVMKYMSLEQFETMMSVLVEAKRVRKQGELYFPIAST